VLENQTGAGGSRTIMSLRHSDGRDIPVEIDATAVELDGQRMTVEVLRPLERTIRFSQEQRLSAIGLLANGVAHEIHNPLASIRLALQASLRGSCRHRGGHRARQPFAHFSAVFQPPGRWQPWHGPGPGGVQNHR
jgi:nitrogen-specific signal transduction histidine kinase